MLRMCVFCAVIGMLAKSVGHSASCMMICVFCIPPHPRTRVHTQGGRCVAFVRGGEILIISIFQLVRWCCTFRMIFPLSFSEDFSCRIPWYHLFTLFFSPATGPTTPIWLLCCKIWSRSVDRWICSFDSAGPCALK